MSFDPMGPLLHLPDRQWDTDDDGLDPDDEEDVIEDDETPEPNEA